MHLNSVQLIGHVSKNGPKVNYASNGNPTCTFTLEVDELGKGGEVFTLYLPVEIWGQAEHAAEMLEPGDEVMLSGRLKDKSVVDAKSQVKVSKLIMSSWGISQRLPGKTSGPAEGGFYLTRGDRRAWTDW
jgi:single-stranded DNA-binding protein